MSASGKVEKERAEGITPLLKRLNQKNREQVLNMVNALLLLQEFEQKSASAPLPAEGAVREGPR